MGNNKDDDLVVVEPGGHESLPIPRSGDMGQVIGLIRDLSKDNRRRIVDSYDRLAESRSEFFETMDAAEELYRGSTAVLRDLFRKDGLLEQTLPMPEEGKGSE